MAPKALFGAGPKNPNLMQGMLSVWPGAPYYPMMFGPGTPMDPVAYPGTLGGVTPAAGAAMAQPSGLPGLHLPLGRGARFMYQYGFSFPNSPYTVFTVSGYQFMRLAQRESYPRFHPLLRNSHFSQFVVIARGISPPRLLPLPLYRCHRTIVIRSTRFIGLAAFSDVSDSTVGIR